MMVWFEYSIVKLFHFSHFADFVALNVVLAPTLHINTDADSERNGGHYEGDRDHHDNLVVF